MLLGIDVGNTNIVAALIDNGEVIAQCRYATAKNEKALYHKKQLDYLTSNQDISGVIISSVVPEVNDDLKEACAELTKIYRFLSVQDWIQDLISDMTILTSWVQIL